jgi:hypothetical protein
MLWIIWLGITSGVVAIQFTIGGGLPTGKNPPDATMPPIALVALIEIFAATAVRWFVLQRMARLQQQLVIMIIGLALAENPVFFGIFLVPPDQPQTKLLIFLLSLFGVLQFAPTYARDPRPIR